MPPNIVLPLDIRAGFTDDTRKGRSAFVDNMRKTGAEGAKALAAGAASVDDSGGYVPNSGGVAGNLGAGVVLENDRARVRELQQQKRRRDAAREARYQAYLDREAVRNAVSPVHSGPVKPTASGGFMDRFMGGTHGARVFSDQSTTGLGVLGRFTAGGLSSAMGIGAAGMGAAVALKTLADMSTKAVEYNNLWKQGKVSAGEMALEVAKQIPILGNIVEIGTNVRELITGEKFAYEQNLKYIEMIGRAEENRHKSAVEELKNRQHAAEELRKAYREIDAIGMRGQPRVEYDIESTALAKIAAAEQGIREAKLDAMMKSMESREPEKEFNRNQGLELDRLEKKKGFFTWDLAGNPWDEERKEELRGQGASAKQAADQDANLIAKDKENKIKKLEEDKKNAELEGKRSREESRRLYQEQLQIDEEGHRSRMRAQAGQMQAEQQRLSGDTKAAALAEVDVKYKAMEDENLLAAAAEKRATSSHARQAEIEQRSLQQRAVMATQYGQERAKIEKEFALAAKEAAFEQQEAEIKSAQEMELEKMRVAGQGGEAQMRALEQNAAREKRVISERLAQKLAVNKSTEAADIQRAMAEMKAVDARLAGDKRAQTEANRQQAASAEQGVLGQEITAMREKAGAGDIAAAAEAAKLEVKARFAAQRNELEATINNPNTSKQLQARAARVLAGVDQQEQMALAMSGVMGGGKLPTLAAAGRTSGFAERYREQNSPFIQLVNINKQMLAALQGIQTAAAATAAAANQPKRTLLPGRS